jgi:hypothetical protein
MAKTVNSKSALVRVAMDKAQEISIMLRNKHHAFANMRWQVIEYAEYYESKCRQASIAKFANASKQNKRRKK